MSFVTGYGLDGESYSGYTVAIPSLVRCPRNSAMCPATPPVHDWTTDEACCSPLEQYPMDVTLRAEVGVPSPLEGAPPTTIRVTRTPLSSA